MEALKALRNLFWSVAEVPPENEDKYDDPYEILKYYIGARIPLKINKSKIEADAHTIENLLHEALREALEPDDTADLPPHETLKQKILTDFAKAAQPLPFDGATLNSSKKGPRFMMAPPDKYKQDDRYDGDEGGEQDLASRIEVFGQWLSLQHALIRAGASIELMEIENPRGSSREVYTRDRFAIIGGKAYIPDIAMLETTERAPSEIMAYAREVLQADKALRERGIPVVTVKGAWFEGGNIVRHKEKRIIFFGIDPNGNWSTEESAQKFLKTVNATQYRKWDLLPVPLARPDTMYHLDTGMSDALPHGEVVISSLVTDEQTFKKIKKIVGTNNIIELEDDEAEQLGANLLCVGKTIILTDPLPDLQSFLEERGYEVINPDDYGLSSFGFGQAGVHCLAHDLPSARKNRHFKPPHGPK